MKKFLRWFIILVGVLLVLAVTALLCRDVVIKKFAVRRIEQRTGLRAEIGLLQTGLRSSTILLQRVKLYNRPDFGRSLLLDLPELFVEMDSPFAAGGKIHFKQLRLNLAELNVIRGRDGRLNIDQLDRPDRERRPAAASTNAPAQPSAERMQFAGIDRLLLTIGRIKYTDLQRPSLSREVDVGLKDEVITSLKTDEDLQTWVSNQILRLIAQELSKPDAKGRKRRVEMQIEPPVDGATNTEPVVGTARP